MSERIPALEPGSKFGRYVITRVLGSGGMGAVYEAIHSDLKKRVALKVLHPEFAHQESVQARFLREGELASRIRHPHVVDVTDFGIQDDLPFLVMEFLEGESLRALLSRKGTLAPQRIADIMLPVCAGVGAAHDAGVVHRDLKPDNIFLEKTKHGEIVPKVVDFGISKVTEQGQLSNLTSTGAMVGTPAYMSPEQMRTSKMIDGRTDQYALGVILYECATGAKPFDGETLFDVMSKVVAGEYTKPRTRLGTIPETFEALIVHAMKAAADERFESVRTLGRALLPFSSERTRLLWSAELGEETGMHSAMSAEEAAKVADGGATPAERPSATKDSSLAIAATELDARARAAASRPKTGVFAGAIGLVVLLGGVGIYWRVAHTSEPTATRASVAVAAPEPVGNYAVNVTVEPAVASIQVDGLTLGMARLRARICATAPCTPRR